MNKRLVINQYGEKDCGPACLLSIMRYYNVDASLDEVSYILKTDKNGTNAYNIINGSRTFGFDGYGIHYSYEDIVNGKINFPIICHTLVDNMYHFIVVYGVKKKYLEIMDPSSNIHKINKSDFKKIYLNTSIVIYQVKKIESIKNHKGLISLIFDYIRKEKNIIIKTNILSIIVTIFSLFTNYYLLISIDKILPSYNYQFFMIITIIFIMINIFKNIFDYIRTNYLIYIQNKIYSDLNINIIRKLFNLPYQFFKNKSTGEIESRLNDLRVFKTIISNIIVNLSIDILFILFSSIILIFINYKLYLINIFILLIYYLIILLFKNIFIKNTEESLIYEGNYSKCINESINGYESIKNLNMINNILYKIEVKFLSMIHKVKKYERSLNKEYFLKNLIVDISYIICVFISINYIHKNIISVGEFILFNSILIYFTSPIKNILDFNHNIIYLKNVYRRINDLIIINNKNDLLNEYNIYGDIDISNLSYNNLFNDININIPYKSKFLLYGSSGNGKSTIMKMLLKYINDYDGCIKINNINLKDISSNAIQNTFNYISQNEYLNNDTIKNNIIYDRDISNNSYEEVINICNLNHLINSKKNRNDFIIEDNGFNISGGERQKIILARCLLKPFDYLILDEALSEVDIEEEKLIMKRLFRKYKDKTIIYISHKEELVSLFKMKYKLERRGNER